MDSIQFVEQDLNEKLNPLEKKDTYKQLEELLMNVNISDCVIIIGDFNSPLARNTQNRVGKWCIHKRSDSGGNKLLNIMQTMSLREVSTYFQPSRHHNNATYINIQPDKPPSQIDYILVSNRWASSIRQCQTKWGLTMQAYGRKYDHGLIKAKFCKRPKCQRNSRRKDFNALRKWEIANAHGKTTKS